MPRAKGQWECPGCGTTWDTTPDFCPKCGTSSDERAITEAARQSTVRVEPVGDVPPIDAAVRVVALFGIVGLGLAASLLIVLWSAGFFGAAHLIPGFARPIIATGALGLTFFFAMLIGGSVAAIGSIYIADRSPSRDNAVAAGAAASAIGHLLMITVIALTLLITIYATVGGANRIALPTPEPSAAAQCAKTFGANSEICKGSLTFPAAGELKVPGVGLTAKNVGKLAMGAIPSAIVGALAAAALFDRRRRQP